MNAFVRGEGILPGDGGIQGEFRFGARRCLAFSYWPRISRRHKRLRQRCSYWRKATIRRRLLILRTCRLWRAFPPINLGALREPRERRKLQTDPRSLEEGGQPHLGYLPLIRQAVAPADY